MDNQSKNKLLKRLKIDRTETVKSKSLSFIQGVVIAILFTVLGGLTVLFYARNTSSTALTNTQSLPTSLNEQPVTPSQYQTGATNLHNSQQVERTEYVLNASGYITARRTATVSSEIMGLIDQVLVEEGMQVNRGEILAKLDDTIATIDLKLAKAQVETAIAKNKSALALLTEAQRQYERTYNNQFSSDAERTNTSTNLLTATATYASSKAEKNIAQLSYERKQERLADHTIRSPFDGVVVIKNAQTGEIVSPGSAGGSFTRTGICTIVDMDSLEIEVDVNESFIARVYPDQRVEAHLDAYPAWTIPASVIAIIPTADRGKATVTVRIRIETKDNKILPDMGVKVAFLK